MIHAKAHVDTDCQIGYGTKIWQFASVTRGAILGDNCSVSPFVMLDGSVYGDECLFGAGFAAGAGFKVGNRVFFGPGSLLVNDVWPATNKIGYEEEALRGNKSFAIIIEDDVCIGAHAIVMPGVRIGKGSVVAANAMVHQNIPENYILTRSGKLISRTFQGNIRMRWAS